MESNLLLCIIIMAIMPVFLTVSAEIPSGYILRDLSVLSGAFATDIEWLPGDTSAVWIEHPPNALHLSRLVHWNNNGTTILLPVGLGKYIIGEIDTQTVILVSAREPDSLDWRRHQIFICYPPVKCEKLGLPVGDMAGLVRWDSRSDTVFFALCTDPYKAPVRFSATFEGEIQTTERPLPMGSELPVGILPEDSTEPCFAALFPPRKKPEYIETDSIAGSISETGLTYRSKRGVLIVSEGEDSLSIVIPNAGNILDIDWTETGERALISAVGNPSRVILLVLVYE